MTLQLDLSIGPVQGFVAQSRRTRDLWGSSYLLAFLAAHAMRGITHAGGRIVRPAVNEDPLYAWVCASKDRQAGLGEAPRIGSVPNHFVAELDDGVAAAAVAAAGIQALHEAWQQVCQAVWQRFLEAPSSRGEGTEAIWQRQISTFWEVHWVAGDAAAGGGLLARRKHWRSHRLPEEPGDKCTLMPDFQELSGLVRAQSRDCRERQEAFWDRLRRDVGPLDLRPDERLCAIALVKRLFPQVARNAIGWELDVSRWPSTAGMAAVPWLQRVCLAAPPQAAAFADALHRTLPQQALKVSPRAIPALASLRSPLLGLDANYLQTSFLTDERLCPLQDSDSAEQRQPTQRHPVRRQPNQQPPEPDKRRQELIRLLQQLQRTCDDQGVPFGKASVFYALLLADGDRLGQLVGSLGGEAVGAALAAFTDAVPAMVAQHQGVTIYAGGDDVLAMLPVPEALACAAALAERYSTCFRAPAAKGTGSPSPRPSATTPQAATLSAAVVFAHVRLPLGAVLREAHRLLDDVAKDQNGRNSLAVAVLKRGGLNSLWTTTWQRPIPPATSSTSGTATSGAATTPATSHSSGTDLPDPALAGSSSSAIDQLNSLAAVLRQRLSQPGLSSSLLYRLRDTLSLLCNWPQWEPGAWGPLPAGLDLRPFVHAEVISSLTDQGIKDVRPLSLELTERLLPLLSPARTTNGDGDGPSTGAPPTATQRSAAQRPGHGSPALASEGEVGIDALLLARFLAAPSQEDDDS